VVLPDEVRRQRHYQAFAVRQPPKIVNNRFPRSGSFGTKRSRQPTRPANPAISHRSEGARVSRQCHKSRRFERITMDTPGRLAQVSRHRQTCGDALDALNRLPKLNTRVRFRHRLPSSRCFTAARAFGRAGGTPAVPRCVRRGTQTRGATLFAVVRLPLSAPAPARPGDARRRSTRCSP